MPLFQYFGWWGAVFSRRCLPRTGARPHQLLLPHLGVPLNQRINIRIHTDHKWPERVVFDTTRPALAHEAKIDPGYDIGRSETFTQAEREPFEAFAEMEAIHSGPCFRPPCLCRQAAERDALPVQKEAPSRSRLSSSTAARKSFTSPNPLHRPPGRS